MKSATNTDEFYSSYPDWRGDLLKELHQLITEAVPELTQEFKWGVPVWTHNGIVCAISGFKDHVKINFFKGANIRDPKGLFNAGLAAKESRAIDFAENDSIDKPALKELVLAAASYNQK